MSIVEIPSIEFENNRIKNCSIKIDKNLFNVTYIDGKYVVKKGGVAAKAESKEAAPSTETKEASKEANAPPVVASKEADAPPVVASNEANAPPVVANETDVAVKESNEEWAKEREKQFYTRLKTKLKKVVEPKKRGKKAEQKAEHDKALFSKIAERKKTVESQEAEAEFKKTMEKYEKKLKVGTPPDAVKIEMKKDGITEEKIDKFFNSRPK